jgi:hypothetical protein
MKTERTTESTERYFVRRARLDERPHVANAGDSEVKGPRLIVRLVEKDCRTTPFISAWIVAQEPSGWQQVNAFPNATVAVRGLFEFLNIPLDAAGVIQEVVVLGIPRDTSGSDESQQKPMVLYPDTPQVLVDTVCDHGLTWEMFNSIAGEGD